MLFGGLVAGTGCLGMWQAQRYYWKVEQVEERAQSLRKEATPLTDPPEPFRPYTLRGTFLHDNELLVGPRSAPKSIHGPAQGQPSTHPLNRSRLSSSTHPPTRLPGMSTNPQGYYVLTPFRCQEDG